MADPSFVTQALRDQDRERAIVQNTIEDLGGLVADRSPLNAQCEEVAALIVPEHVGSFYSPGLTRPYQKKTDQQIDSNGMVALSRYEAICDSMLTPQNSIYQGLAASGRHARDLMKDRDVKLWFYNQNQSLFRMRYAPVSNFVSQNQANWKGLGSYGSGIMYHDKFYDLNRKINAIRYISIPFGSIYLKFNHQGLVDGFIRIIRMKARKAVKVPEWKGKLPLAVENAALKNPLQEFTFLQHVCPRDDYKPWAYNNLNMPYAAYYVCMETSTFLSESGYRSLPISVSQYGNAPGEENARSPAMAVLPALKTLNAQKRTFLKQGHRAADPVLLTGDDGIIGASLKPGALNKGGVNSDGKAMVQILPTGEIQTTIEMMEMEKQLIDTMFLNDLFNIALERKSGTTATEIVDEINKRGILIAPSMGRQQNYLAHMTDRDLDLMSQMGELDPMPPVLKEAGGDFQLVYLNPLAKAMRAGEVGGFMRTVETVKEIVNITGDNSLLDPFDFDTATPEIAWINGSPEPWMSGPDKIAAKRQQRAKAAQMDASIKAAPGAASLISANAKAAQAGVAPAQRDLTQGAPPAA